MGLLLEYNFEKKEGRFIMRLRSLYLTCFSLLVIAHQSLVWADKIEKTVPEFSTLIVSNAVEVHLYRSQTIDSYVTADQKYIFDTIDMYTHGGVCEIWQDDPLEQVINLYVSGTLEEIKVSSNSSVVIHDQSLLRPEASLEVDSSRLKGVIRCSALMMTVTSKSQVQLQVSGKVESADIYADNTSLVTLKAPLIWNLVAVAESNASLDLSQAPVMNINASAFSGAGIQILDATKALEFSEKVERKQQIVEDSLGRVTLVSLRR